MFRITKVKANLFEYVYASTFRISIPCTNFQPQVSKIDITPFDKASNRYKDDFPQLSTFLLSSAKQLVVESDDSTVRQVHPFNFLIFSIILNRFTDYSSTGRLLVILRAASITAPIP